MNILYCFTTHGLVILYLLTGQMYHTFYKSLWAWMGHRRSLFHKNADFTTDFMLFEQYICQFSELIVWSNMK